MSRSAFEGLADRYARFRPGYPDEAIRAIWDYALEAEPAGSELVALDVGAGTGISTRALAAAAPPGTRIVGIEPNASMRREAQRGAAGDSRVRYVDGSAEEVPAEAASAFLVLVGQSIQWFDRPAFYRQAARVLEPGGALAIVQNNRDWGTSPMLAAYEDFLEQGNPGYSRFYRAFDLEAELRRLPDFEQVRVRRAGWTRRMPLDDFLGMTTSSTKMAPIIEARGSDAALGQLRARLAPHVDDPGAVAVPYVTEVFLARRAGV